MERIGNLIENDSSLLLQHEHDVFADSVLKTKSPATSIPSATHSGTSSKSDTLVNEIWNKVTSYIKPEIDEKIYAAWFKSLHIKTIDIIRDGDSKKAKVVFSVPNKFCRDHIKNNYSKIIENCFNECLGFEASLGFEVSTDSPERKTPSLAPISSEVNKASFSSSIISSGSKEAKKITTPRTVFRSDKSSGSTTTTPNDTNLNTGYNFSNFVIGSCNQFAHAACLKVSESPGTSYNPLLIYGGVGLGKTHLANAVGNAASRRKKKVLLASSETFVSELIGSLRTNTMDKFKNKFRSLDILIIDDIQFIIGKERTQEEFFHTFNELYGNKKQIIITSDKLPQDLIGLEERLRTRFASGLSVDLQAPDFETRVAILSKKAELSGLEIPPEVAGIIAGRIDTNVRELEGALTRLQALCSLLGEKPSLEIAQKVIDTIAPAKNKELTTDAIKQMVAKQFNVSINDLTGKRRTQNIALARQVAMFLCRKHTARSFPEIGALFGGRDHSTVIHAIKSVNERISSDPVLKEQIEKIILLLEK
jgi:chromosomal replication initiator protein